MSDQVTIIERQRKIRLIHWREFLAYKDLLYFLVIRGIKARYAQSVLGIGWALIQPLLNTLIFTIVFGRLAKIGSDGVPYVLFSFCGLMAWTYFSGAVSDSSASLVTNANMLSKVYFPRLILPFSSVFSKLLDFAITVIVMMVLLIVYHHKPPVEIVYFPLLVLLLMIAASGPGILLSGWSVQYRDLKYAMSFVIQLLMYAAPVVYPLSSIPEQYRLIYSINPMVGIIEGFRASVLGTGVMPWMEIGMGTFVSCLVLVYALYSFSKLERTFADVA